MVIGFAGVALCMCLLGLSGCSSTSTNPAGSGGSGGSGPDVLLSDGFEGAASCDKWVPFGVTAIPDAAFASEGTKSCKICLTADGEGRVEKPVAHLQAGAYSLSGVIRSDQPLPYNAGVWLTASDGGVGLANNSGSSSTDWTTFQAVATPSEPPTEMHLNINFLGAAGDCCHLDQIRLVFEP